MALAEHWAYEDSPVAPEDLLTASQASDLLHVNEQTVRRWAEDKRIAHIVLPSGQRRYRRSDIDAILRGVGAAGSGSDTTAEAS